MKEATADDSLGALVRAAFEARREASSSVFDTLELRAADVRLQLPDAPGKPELQVVDPTSGELPTGGDQGGRYEIHGEFARGGIGVVLRARDRELGRDVAMKVLRTDRVHDASALRRFLEEAQIGGQLEHPGVVPVHDVGVSQDGRPFFTMKLVTGCTLSDRLRHRAGIVSDRQELISVFGRVCQTLAYAHARGVVHRDIKPANLLLGDYGEVVVVDWGLAEVVSKPGHTEPARVAGTPAYMAPEQARGEAIIDARSDVFALGAILCEILTGEPPYPSTTKSETLELAKAGDLAEASARLQRSEADAELVDLALRCLSANPEDRPLDANELILEIQEYLASVEERARAYRVAAEVATTKEREALRRASAERRARNMTIALGSSALAFVMAAAGWILVWRGNRIEEREQLAAAVNTALLEAERSRGKARGHGGASSPGWQEARLAAERADALLAGRPDMTALADRVEALLAELRSEEEELRLLEERARREEALFVELGAVFEAGRSWVDVTDPKETKRAYDDAFARNGLDPEEQSRQEVIAWIRSWKGVDALLPYLEDWVFLSNYLGGGGSDSVVGIVEALAEIEDGSLRIWILESILAGDADELVRIAESGELETEKAATLNLLGFGLEQLGRSKQATEVWRYAQRRYPDDYVLNGNLAAMLALGPYPRKYGEAVEYLRAALAARPESITTRHWLGDVLRLADREDEAAGVLQEAASLAPDHGGVLASLAGVYQSRGDFDQAVRLARRAVALDPENGKVAGLLATALWDQGNREEALEAMRRARDLEPQNAQLWNFLGEFVLETGSVEDAIEAFERATALDPSRPLYRDNLEQAKNRRP